MCPAEFVSSPSQFSAVSAIVENSGKDTNVVVFTPQFISFLLINDCALMPRHHSQFAPVRLLRDFWADILTVSMLSLLLVWSLDWARLTRFAPLPWQIFFLSDEVEALIVTGKYISAHFKDSSSTKRTEGPLNLPQINRHIFINCL